MTSKKNKYVIKYIKDFLTFYNKIDPTLRLSVFRIQLKNILKIKYIVIFFRINVYFQIKLNEDIIKPDIPEFKALEKLEIEGYKVAKELKYEIL